MEIGAEPLAPWLIGALALASLLIVGYFTEGVSDANRAALIVALATLVTTAALIEGRSRSRQRAVNLEHRQRPAADELLDGVPQFVGDGSSYVIGMLGWVEAMGELIDHAVAASGEAVPDELVAAGDDTAALHEMLNDAFVHHPSNVGMSRLHPICTLWELDQPRVEAVAAEIDPGFHQRWRARTIIARRLRRGDPAAVSTGLSGELWQGRAS